MLGDDADLVTTQAQCDGVGRKGPVCRGRIVKKIEVIAAFSPTGPK